MQKNIVQAVVPPGVSELERARGVWRGKFFLWVTPNARRTRKLETAMAAAGGSVLPIYGSQVALDRVTVRGVPPYPRPFVAMATDRDVYRASHDVASLFVCDASKAGKVVAVQVRRGTHTVRTVQVALDANGLGVGRVADLPAGPYRIVYRRDESARFEVAEYTLPRMSAIVRRVTLDGDKLGVTVDVRVGGRPFSGRLKAGLLQEGRVVRSTTFEADDGIAMGRFVIREDGPFSVHLTAERHPGLDAQVPLPATAVEDREQFILSRLGKVWKAAGLSRPGAQPCRGIWVWREGETEARLELHEGVAQVARLRARHPIEGMTISLKDYGAGTMTHRFVGDVPAGGIVEVPVPRPFGVALIGGWKDGGLPYETATCLIAPSTLGITVDAPQRADAGHPLEVRLRTDRPDAAVSVAVVVRDVRTRPISNLPGAMGGQLRAAIASADVYHPPDVTVSTDPDAEVVYARWPDLEAAGVLRDLVDRGQLSAENVEAARPRCPGDLPLIEALLDREQVRERHVAESLARLAGLPFEDLRTLPVDPTAAKCLPSGDDRRLGVVPVALGEGVVRVAVVNPWQPDLVEQIRAWLGLAVSLVVVEPWLLHQRLQSNDHGGPLCAMEYDVACDRSDGSFAKSVVPAVAPLRERFVDVAYSEVLQVRGEATITVPLGDGLGRYEVTAFAVHDGDWAEATAELDVSQDLHGELQLPGFVHEGDSATGRLEVAWTQGPVQIELTCDGRPVALTDEPVPAAPPRDWTAPSGLASLTFAAGPGRWESRVRDASQREDISSRTVARPGVFTREVHTLRVLAPGEVAAAVPGVVALRVFHAEPALTRLADSTAGFAHLCAEQTAAKLCGAMFAWMNAGGDGHRARIEANIGDAVERLRALWVRGQGWRPYEHVPVVSPLTLPALEHLLMLDAFRATCPFDARLDDAIRGLAEVVDDLAKAHQIEREPTAMKLPGDLYRGVAHGRIPVERGVELARARLAQLTPEMTPVFRRAEHCRAAAVMLRSDDPAVLREAIGLFNGIATDLTPDGRLYSTYDSAAAIGMFRELGVRNLLGGPDRRVRIDGTETRIGDAACAKGEVSRIEAVDAPVLVQISSRRTEDWTAATSGARLNVRLTRDPGAPFEPGVPFTLQLESGAYRDGDFVKVCLPPSLARLAGGARVQSFEVDLAGRSRVDVPLVAVDGGPAVSPRQRWFACLRNMYAEDRVGNPGLLELETGPLTS